MPVPSQKTPPLALATVAHGRVDLDAVNSGRGVLLCFYRGLHCPLCAGYLGELEKATQAFAERGLETLAISTDDRDRAARMAEKVEADALRFAYGLSLAVAREWGLYLSSGRGPTSAGVEEPALFAEPGIFLVRPDRTLYWAAIQSMPFARPHFGDLLKALDFVIAKDYPPRANIPALFEVHQAAGSAPSMAWPI